MCAPVKVARTKTTTLSMFKKEMSFSIKKKGCRIIVIALRIIAKRSIALATNQVKAVVLLAIAKTALTQNTFPLKYWKSTKNNDNCAIIIL